MGFYIVGTGAFGMMCGGIIADGGIVSSVCNGVIGMLFGNNYEDCGSTI